MHEKPDIKSLILIHIYLQPVPYLLSTGSVSFIDIWNFEFIMWIIYLLP